MLKLERPWTRQPQGVVELSARIPAPVAAIFPWRGSLIEQQQKQAITFTGTDALGVGQGGRAIRHLNSESAYSTIPHHPKYAVTGDLTIIAVVTSLAFSTEQAVLLKGDGTRTTLNHNIPVYFSITTSGGLNLGRCGASVQSYSSSTTSSLIQAGSRPQVIGVTAPAGGTADSVVLARFYANGVSSGATAGYSSGNAAITDAGNPLYIGRWSLEGGMYQFPRNGDTYAILLFNRVLPESLMLALTASPEAFYSLVLAPRRTLIPTAAAATGLPTLSASTFKPGTLTSSGWTARVTAS